MTKGFTFSPCARIVDVRRLRLRGSVVAITKSLLAQLDPDDFATDKITIRTIINDSDFSPAVRDQAKALHDAMLELTAIELAAPEFAIGREYNKMPELYILWSPRGTGCDEPPHLDRVEFPVFSVFVHPSEATNMYHRYHCRANLTSRNEKTTSGLVRAFLHATDSDFVTHDAQPGDMMVHLATALHFNKAPNVGAERAIVVATRQSKEFSTRDSDMIFGFDFIQASDARTLAKSPRSIKYLHMALRSGWRPFEHMSDKVFLKLILAHLDYNDWTEEQCDLWMTAANERWATVDEAKREAVAPLLQ